MVPVFWVDHTPGGTHILAWHTCNLAPCLRSQVRQPVAAVLGVRLPWVRGCTLSEVDQSEVVDNERVPEPDDSDGLYYKHGRQNEVLPHLRYSYICNRCSRALLGSWPSLGPLLILP